MIQSCCPTNDPANARKNLPFSETCLPKARLLSDPLTDKIDKSGGFVMNAYAVVNPLLEAIYYFKMKANGETQAQVLDRVLKKRITTAGEVTDFFGPAFELEKLLDEGIVLPERISEFFGYFKFTDGSDATSTCPAILVF